MMKTALATLVLALAFSPASAGRGEPAPRVVQAAAPDFPGLPADPSAAAGFVRATAKQYWVQARIYRLADLYQQRDDGRLAVHPETACVGELNAPKYLHGVAGLEFVGMKIGHGMYLGDGGEQALKEEIAEYLAPLESFQERGCMRYLRERYRWEWTEILTQLDAYASDRPSRR